MTKIRRLDGQQLSCPVSVSCTECTKHVLRLSFQRELQICSEENWYKSGLGYIKHYKRHHQGLLQMPNLGNPQTTDPQTRYVWSFGVCLFCLRLGLSVYLGLRARAGVLCYPSGSGF